ncbi:transglutaminase-like domain-containing protein [Neobittarella massiliensis]|uniref:transglutaminase-like domain-containing protein n=1 Tax=Neobittarella massiliensis (ex Bilen et al. 2018) TaxID=2041842 RepID=UPI000CF72DD8|nr:transglutaminase-like domain-containing protein [Neobittarella massiliensis]
MKHPISLPSWLKKRLSHRAAPQDRAPLLQNEDFVLDEEPCDISEKKLPRWRFFMALALYLYCAASFLCTFFSLYDIADWRLPPQWLAAATAGAALPFCLPVVRRHPHITGAVVILAAGGATWYFGAGTQTARWGLYAIVNDVIDRINLSTTRFIAPLRLPAQHDTLENIHVCLFYLLALCLLFTAFAVLCRPNIFFFALPTGACLMVGMSYDMQPNYIAFVALIIGWVLVGFLQISVHGSRRRAQFCTRLKKGGTYSSLFVSRFVQEEVRYGAGLTCCVFLTALFALSVVAGLAVFSPPVYQSAPVLAVRQRLGKALVPRKAGQRACDLYNGQVAMTTSYTSMLYMQEPRDLRLRAANTGQTQYFKGFVGAAYLGDRWQSLAEDRAASEGRQFSSSGRHVQNIPADYLALNGPVIKNPALDTVYRGQTDILLLDVMELATRRFTYIPYHASYRDTTTLDMGRDKITGENVYIDVPTEVDPDATMFPRTDRYAGSYSFDYWATPSLLDCDMLGPLQAAAEQNSSAAVLLADESCYRDFVYDYYTRLPENSLWQIRSTYTPQARQQAGSLSGFVERVRADLAATATFSLIENPRPPQGQDYIEHFLYTTKQGHSAHFASAATAMFRAAGIPARYVEGYRADPDDLQAGTADFVTQLAAADGSQLPAQGYTCTLTEKNHHAWVELYIDGFGWVPVEVSPGFVQKTDFDPSLYTGQPLTVKESAGTQPQQVQQQAESAAGPSIGQALKKYGTFSSRVYNLSFLTIGWALIYLLVLALACWLLYLGLRRYVRLHREKRCFYTGDARRDAVALYRYTRRVLACAGVQVAAGASYQAYYQALARALPPQSDRQREDFAQLLQRVLAVGFGAQPLTAQQMADCLEKTQGLVEALYRTLGPIRRLRLRLIQALW